MLLSGTADIKATADCRNLDICSIRSWKVYFSEQEPLLTIAAEPDFLLHLFLPYTNFCVLSRLSSYLFALRLLILFLFLPVMPSNSPLLLFSGISTIACYLDITLFPLLAPKMLLFPNIIGLRIIES